MVLSQLSNSTAREGANSGNIEYRGSGTIAIACDLGMFIERDQEEPERIKFFIKKNRRGISHVVFENFKFVTPGGWIKEL